MDEEYIPISGFRNHGFSPNLANLRIAHNSANVMSASYRLVEYYYNIYKYNIALVMDETSDYVNLYNLIRLGMYGDFGRYVFQSALRDFEVDDYKIFNYAMYYIINELGYSGELFDDYDTSTLRLTYDRHYVLKTERIGKKYQWISMYNILARVSDYCVMKRVGSMEEDVSYEGPWNPYVRDFDPTLNEHNLVCEDAPLLVEVKEHIMNEIQEIKCAKEDPSFDEEIWINTVPTFYENQKEDLLLTDEGGIQWVALSKYADTGKGDLAYNKLLIWNWLYGYFVTDEQLVTLKKYADKKVNLINSDISWIPETYTIYNREYPWSSGSKSIEESQWENIKVETGEMKSIIEKVEEPQFSYAEILQKKYLGEFDEDKKWDELGTALDDKISIPMVSKQYTREEPVTVELGRVLNSCQDLIWEEEFDASKEETISASHPCAEIIKVLGLSQKKYDGYYCNEAGELIAFDTALTKQKAGLIIRKDALDEFLSIKNFHLVWFVNASKEIHDESLMIKKYTDWTGLLEYKGDFVEGEYYITEYR